MTLSDREKLAFAVGTMMLAHWHNFHDFNYGPTFNKFVHIMVPGKDYTVEEAKAMNEELKMYFEDLDYQLDKGMKKMQKEEWKNKN